MEWLILLLLVPAILVPIVLLCGFTGCSFCAALGDVDPPAVTAIPKNVDHITVSWQPVDPGTIVGYRLVRKRGNVTERDEPVDASTTTVEDTGLEAGTEYTYEVSTTVVKINCDDEPENHTSDPGTVTTSTFRTVFGVDPATIPTDQTIAPANYCFVQRIPAGQLLAAGGKVGLKVWGSPSGNVTINSIYISRAAGAGNLWDSDTDITPVKPVMTPPLTVNDIPTDLVPIDYSLGQVQDLIIAFDFAATAGQANVRFAAVPGVTLYFKAGVQQASMPIRDPDYLTQPDPRLYLVVTVGVP